MIKSCNVLGILLTTCVTRTECRFGSDSLVIISDSLSANSSSLNLLWLLYQTLDKTAGTKYIILLCARILRKNKSLAF
jgi:hypothetical protein